MNETEIIIKELKEVEKRLEKYSYYTTYDEKKVKELEATRKVLINMLQIKVNTIPEELLTILLKEDK